VKDLICFLSAFFDEKINNIAINEVEDKFSGDTTLSIFTLMQIPRRRRHSLWTSK
jgi:hypothetical protein